MTKCYSGDPIYVQRGSSPEHLLEKARVLSSPKPLHSGTEPICFLFHYQSLSDFRTETDYNTRLCLPLSTYTDMSAIQECPICFEILTVRAAVVLRCGHMFHESCIKATVKVAVPSKCPLCQQKWGSSDLVRIMSGLPDADEQNSSENDPTETNSRKQRSGSQGTGNASSSSGQLRRGNAAREAVSRSSVGEVTVTKRIASGGYPIYRSASAEGNSKAESAPSQPNVPRTKIWNRVQYSLRQRRGQQRRFFRRREESRLGWSAMTSRSSPLPEPQSPEVRPGLLADLLLEEDEIFRPSNSTRSSVLPEQEVTSTGANQEHVNSQERRQDNVVNTICKVERAIQFCFFLGAIVVTGYPRVVSIIFMTIATLLHVAKRKQIIRW